MIFEFQSWRFFQSNYATLKHHYDIATNSDFSGIIESTDALRILVPDSVTRFGEISLIR